MSTEQLEQRLTAVEKAVEAVRARVDQMSALQAKGVLSVVGSMKDFPEFEDVVAYGRYFRQTGQLPPPSWRPGDPIPETDQ